MIERIRSYPAYKDSGVSWLGQVPAHWQVTKLKHVVAFSGGGTPSKADASFWHGRIPWVSPKDMRGAWITDAADHISDEAVRASAARLIPPGALLMVVRSGILRRTIPVAINAVEVALNQDMKALRPKACLLSGYLRALIEGNEAALIAEWTKQGATVESIEQELLANSEIPLPSLAEQTSIIRFLNYSDLRIRRYIRAKQKLIKLLEEQKRAIIHRAVTRGLDPNVRLKPSGVEWLGDVPEHWVVASLRHRYDQCLGKMLDTKTATGQHPTHYLRNVDVRWDAINVENLPVMDIPPQERSRFTLQVGDLLVCEGRHLGRAAFWRGDLDVCGFQKALHRLRALAPSRDTPRFLYYCLLVVHQLDAFGASSSDNSIPHLTGEMLRAHRFPFPPREEQDDIVLHLDDSCMAFSRAAQGTMRQIDLLREYRTRLIADVVTGKVDVREAAARLPTETEEDEPLDEEDSQLEAEDALDDDLEHAREAADA